MSFGPEEILLEFVEAKYMGRTRRVRFRDPLWRAAWSREEISARRLEAHRQKVPAKMKRSRARFDAWLGSLEPLPQWEPGKAA